MVSTCHRNKSQYNAHRQSTIRMHNSHIIGEIRWRCCHNAWHLAINTRGIKKKTMMLIASYATWMSIFSFDHSFRTTHVKIVAIQRWCMQYAPPLLLWNEQISSAVRACSGITKVDFSRTLKLSVNDGQARCINRHARARSRHISPTVLSLLYQW